MGEIKRGKRKNRKHAGREKILTEEGKKSQRNKWNGKKSRKRRQNIEMPSVVRKKQ